MMRKLTLPSDAMQEALDAATNAPTKGVQQFFTPPAWASALCSAFEFDGNCSHHVGDLFGSGIGHLLAPFRDKETADLWSIDLDPKCKPEGSHHLQGDCSAAIPLLLAVQAKFHVLVANPPFSLVWQTPEGQVNSTIATMRWMPQLLTRLGQGLIICNASSLPALQQLPEWRYVQGAFILPNFFPGTGRWGEMKIAAIYLSPEIDKNVRPDDWSHLDREEIADRMRYAKLPVPNIHFDAATEWKAVAEELARRRRSRTAGHDLYHIILRPDGSISTWLSLYERLTTTIDPELVATLHSLNKHHLRELVVARSQRNALEHAVHSGIWQVDPQLSAAVSQAILEYSALRCPMRPLSAVQRLGYLDEHHTILCTKSVDSFHAGERYPLKTEMVKGYRTQFRPRYDKPPLIPGDPPPREEIEITGLDLKITIGTGSTAAHFIRHPNPQESTRPLTELIKHFQVPEVPTAADSKPEAYQEALAMLAPYAPKTTPPRSTSAKPAATHKARTPAPRRISPALHSASPATQSPPPSRSPSVPNRQTAKPPRTHSPSTPTRRLSTPSSTTPTHSTATSPPEL